MNINKIQGELGYWVGEPYWGMGYCTEAVKILIQFSFQTLRLEKIVAEHLTSNLASGKVMQKVGMHHTLTTQKINRHEVSASSEVYEIQNI